jgi:hypothetical protein
MYFIVGAGYPSGAWVGRERRPFLERRPKVRRALGCIPVLFIKNLYL